jgi:hypothetical protein
MIAIMLSQEREINFLVRFFTIIFFLSENVSVADFRRIVRLYRQKIEVGKNEKLKQKSSFSLQRR